MLVKLNFITAPEWALRGITLSSKPMDFDYIGDCTLFKATFEHHHPFWVDKVKPEDSNVVMTIAQTAYDGVLAGYHAKLAINNFTDYDVVDEYPMIHADGSLYTTKDFSAMINSTDEILPSGRKRPDSMCLESSYGVADTLEQIFKKYKKLIEGDEEVVMCCHTVHKSDEPERGGWRWHKNGEYIGTKRSKERFEYLYDEPDVEAVICYNFIKVKRKEYVSIS